MAKIIFEDNVYLSIVLHCESEGVCTLQLLFKRIGISRDIVPKSTTKA